MSEYDAMPGRGRSSRRRRGGVLAILTLASTLLPVVAAAPASARTKASADISISVSDVSDPVFTGAPVSYVVTVPNAGPSDATSVRATTQLPAGVQFEAARSDPNCSATGGLVTCVEPLISANAVAMVVLAVTPTVAGSLQLTFTATAAEADPDPSNNTDIETTQVVDPTEADLSIDVPAAVTLYAGGSTFWTFSVFNAGPATATGVTVTVELPTGLRLGAPASCADSAGGVTCTYALGDLPAQRGYGVPVLLTAAAAGSYEVRARVSADQPDPNPGDDVETGLVEVLPAADLAVAIAESADPSPPGQPLAYTVTVTNLGPSPAPAVTLTDTWSTTASGGVELLSVGAGSGQCQVTAAQAIACSLGDMASGAVATVTVRLRPRGPGTVTDEAQVSTALDRNLANNTARETTAVG